MKNKVKFQISTLAVLAILLAPSLTYAAWWNPASWFKKPTTPLVSKVIQVATTTPATKPVVATPKTPVVKKGAPAVIAKPVVTPPPKTVDQNSEIQKLKKEVSELRRNQAVKQSVQSPATPTVGDEENWTSHVAGSLDLNTKSYIALKNYIESNISFVEDAIRHTKKVKYMFMGARDTFPRRSPNELRDIAIFNGLVELSNKNIQYYEDVISSFNAIETRIDTNVQVLKDHKLRVLPMFFTREEAIAEIKRINDMHLPIMSLMNDEIASLSKRFDKYDGDRIATYEQVSAYQIASLVPPVSANTVEDSSRVFSQPSAPAQLPRYTQCSVQTLGKNTTSEQSFISCY